MLKKVHFSTAVPFEMVSCFIPRTERMKFLFFSATTPKMLKDDNSNNSAAACLLTENQNQFPPTTIQGDLVS